ncbi:hypothetical protein OIV19_21795 [Brucella sp. HL-2]|nr:hypothetical protein [Brucella sp. HL-2]MCV9910231.1 hypothetical protein [Brucella sp. HL-2]
MAMRPLGLVAGLGASLIASGTSLVATLFAIGLGAAYDGSGMVPAAGIFLAGAAAIVLGELSFRVGDAPVVPIVISSENRHSRWPDYHCISPVWGHRLVSRNSCGFIMPHHLK